jgi:hypothetical protein
VRRSLEFPLKFIFLPTSLALSLSISVGCHNFTAAANNNNIYSSSGSSGSKMHSTEDIIHHFKSTIVGFQVQYKLILTHLLSVQSAPSHHMINVDSCTEDFTLIPKINFTLTLSCWLACSLWKMPLLLLLSK